jgi:hypothetical protein
MVPAIPVRHFLYHFVPLGLPLVIQPNDQTDEQDNAKESPEHDRRFQQTLRQ